MQTIIIELTDTQMKGLEYIALSAHEWAENAVTERARIANDEIVQLAVQHYLDNGIPVPATREDIVADAFARQIVKTAAQRQEEADLAAQQELQAQQGV